MLIFTMLMFEIVFSCAVQKKIYIDKNPRTKKLNLIEGILEESEINLGNGNTDEDRINLELYINCKFEIVMKSINKELRRITKLPPHLYCTGNMASERPHIAAPISPKLRGCLKFF
jgi:hypothetical protein